MLQATENLVLYFVVFGKMASISVSPSLCITCDLFSLIRMKHLKPVRCHLQPFILESKRIRKRLLYGNQYCLCARTNETKAQWKAIKTIKNFKLKQICINPVFCYSILVCTLLSFSVTANKTKHCTAQIPLQSETFKCTYL